MRQYRIRGQNRIEGELCVSGAKNAVLPILAALCLNESEVVIHNCPRIADTFVSIEILRDIGCKVSFVGNTLTVDASGDLKHNIPDDCVTKMRSSILFMGAMLARNGRVNLALPGGCKLGARAIDMHISGLESMGAIIKAEGNRLYCEAPMLKGEEIEMHTVSVGATENLMIAAAKAKGETVLKNAAQEPEIVDLARFLNGLGADIRGAGTSTIVINGVKRLCPRDSHRIMPDRIVAGTYLVAAAITAGEIKLTGACPRDMLAVISGLKKMGCRVLTTDSTIALQAPGRLLALPRLVTEAHPGFPTDMQAQFVAALSVADGRSTLRETIFEKRFSHAEELRKMGADIVLSDNKQFFTVYGKKTLYGTTVEAHDLRCGAALVLAALAAEGETIVTQAQHVERGYEHIEKDLAALSANIRVESSAASSEQPYLSLVAG
ncbi:MAG: UDP-N-acetylglucosamine 1-carboxyvinyltransferase [Defluviitaleaceae bacterium]|nr:UDP-N-acetylglucosamine 1-carboxyvinyltransferase [Defluviitaleaceae bacterium]